MKMPKIDLEIIVLNYNNANDTINLVNQILCQELISFHITVIDNCSTDNTFNRLLDLSSSHFVDVIRTDFNGGYAYGNNFGLKAAKKNGAKYAAILNNDISIENTKLFNSLIQEYETLDNPGFIAPLQKDELGNIIFNTARTVPSFLVELANNFLLYSYFFSNPDYYNLDKGTSTLEVEILTGAFLFTSYDYFEQIEFFDEGTFLFLEERILREKVLKTNKINYLIRQLDYVHFTSKSINKIYNNIGQAELYNKGLIYYTYNYARYGRLKCLILKPFLKFKVFQMKCLNLFNKTNA